jgi:hypothetical protein
VSDSKNVANYTDFMGQAFTGKYQTVNCKSLEEEIEKINLKIPKDMMRYHLLY